MCLGTSRTSHDVTLKFAFCMAARVASWNLSRHPEIHISLLRQNACAESFAVEHTFGDCVSSSTSYKYPSPNSTDRGAGDSLLPCILGKVAARQSLADAMILLRLRMENDKFMF